MGGPSFLLAHFDIESGPIMYLGELGLSDIKPEA